MSNSSSRVEAGRLDDVFSAASPEYSPFLQRHLNIHHFVPCVVNKIVKLNFEYSLIRSINLAVLK